MDILFGFSDIFHFIFNPYLFVLVALAAIIFFIIIGLLVNWERHVILLKYMINSLLIIGLSINFVSLLDPFIKLIIANKSIVRSGTGDPRVVFSGIIQFLTHTFFYLLLGATFLLLWSLVNAYFQHVQKKYKNSGS